MLNLLNWFNYSYIGLKRLFCLLNIWLIFWAVTKYTQGVSTADRHHLNPFTLSTEVLNWYCCLMFTLWYLLFSKSTKTYMIPNVGFESNYICKYSFWEVLFCTSTITYHFSWTPIFFLLNNYWHCCCFFSIFWFTYTTRTMQWASSLPR